MSIKCYEGNNNPVRKVFKLDTKNTNYIFGIVDDNGYPVHFYYGDKIDSHDVSYISRIYEYPYYPSKLLREKCSFLDAVKSEYPGHNIGDFREDVVSIIAPDGSTAVEPLYESHEILTEKPALAGLPASFGKSDTLKLTLKDARTGLTLELLYSVFEECDIITRSVRAVNTGTESLYVTKLMSMCLDMEDDNYEVLSLNGAWGRERIMETTSLSHAKVCVESLRGISSHQDHPFIAVKTKGADYDNGRIYAVNLAYSGNFKACVMKDQYDQVRITMGIHPENFKWLLNAGESLQSPEAVMTYSASGLNKMSNSFHDFYRNHLIRSKYKDTKRPILINNWEATYFDFNTDKLISIARQASELGIEMLVMDDGWFGKRNNDDCGLGDWQVNEEKLNGGLKYLVDEVNKLNMKFGIWFEPEMISPDSDLYRAHPDWAIAVKGRAATLQRHQYILDITRKEVRDYAYECVAKILRSANVEYVKWDMNRHITDLWSAELPAERMGEMYHRYVLGVYEMQERLVTEFPDLLLENCASGGGRFDPGMLYYSPQIWCSDDTDAIERLVIQEGTALIYPLSTMGAHVSDCPNHATGRTTPFETRGHVALSGTFGYELDVTKIPKEDVEMIPQQVEMYHRFNDIIRCGDYMRVASYGENGYYDLCGSVDRDKSRALFTYVQVRARINYHSRLVKLKGLDPERVYKLERISDGMKSVIDEKSYTGEELMQVGMLIDPMPGDYRSMLIYLS